MDIGAPVRVNTFALEMLDQWVIALVDRDHMKVRIRLDNPDLLLKPEMFASIEISYPEDKIMNYVKSSQPPL